MSYLESNQHNLNHTIPELLVELYHIVSFIIYFPIFILSIFLILYSNLTLHLKVNAQHCCEYVLLRDFI